MHETTGISALRARLAIAAAVAAVAVAGCAQHSNMNLVEAEAQLRSAEADPTVTSRAPVPLHEAQTSVAAARAAFEAEADEAKVDHLAYLGSRRIEIARAIAARNLANEDVTQLGRDRDAVVLNARTAEANDARQDADEAREETQILALTAEALAAELTALQAKQTERGIVLTLGDVLFDVDRAELKAGAISDLTRLADLLAGDSERGVLIEGHTDSTGPAQHNDELSRQRAEAVASVLIRDGISPLRIKTQGFGSSSPLATNATEAGRQQNRRVEIVVLDAVRGTVGSLR
jgi:outer membrane protein OmpA-like peptidoglycan-associated protein